MGKLSEKVKETITGIRPGIIATSSKDGKPNVSAKGSLRVLDDDHVVFADINSPRTVKNLRENPQIAILVLDPQSRKGCRIWGKGEILDAGDLFNEVSKEYATRNIKVNHVITITVEDAQDSV